MNYLDNADAHEVSPALHFIHAVSNRIAAADPLHHVLDETVQFIAELLSCDSCFIYVREGESLVMRASMNAHPGILDRLTLKVGEGITGWAAEKAEPVVISERAYQDARFCFINELPEDRFEAFISVPVLSRGRVVAVINVQHREVYRPGIRDMKLLLTIAHLLAAAIEMGRMEDQISKLSTKLEERKLIDRAKGVLQRDLGINENEAYTMIQKQARQLRRTMGDIAGAVLVSDELRRSRS